MSFPDSSVTSAIATLAALPQAQVQHMHIVMGLQCNVRCGFCYQQSFAPKDSLPEEVITSKILPLLPNLELLNLQGGEVTVMKSAKRIRDHILQNDFDLKLYMLTNGVLFSDEWFEAFIKQKGSVHFSINASNKEVYDRTVKHGDFDKVINNIRRIADYKNENPLSGIGVTVSCVICETNMWDILSFFSVFDAMGVDAIVYYLDAVDTRTVEGYPDFLYNLSDLDLMKFQGMVEMTKKLISMNKKYHVSELTYTENRLKSLQQHRANKVSAVA